MKRDNIEFRLKSVSCNHPHNKVIETSKKETKEKMIRKGTCGECGVKVTIKYSDRYGCWHLDSVTVDKVQK